MNAEVQQYTEGTLVIDFVDSRTHKLVFRGLGQAGVGSSERNAAAVQEAGNKMSPPIRDKNSEANFSNRAWRAPAQVVESIEMKKPGFAKKCFVSSRRWRRPETHAPIIPTNRRRV